MGTLKASNANGLKFYPQKTSLNVSSLATAILNPNDVRYNSLHFDDSPYIERLQSWQRNEYYFQPWQRSDYQVVQIISGDTSAQIHIIDSDGEVVQTLTMSNVGNLSTEKILQKTIYFSTLDEGNYIVQIDGQDNANYLISEPICVRDKHEGTILFEYKNSYNDQGFIFSKLTAAQYLQFRVHAYIGEYNPQIKGFVYEDQRYNTTSLSAIPHRDYVINFGGEGNAVADWVGDKLSCIFSTDEVKADGVQYCRQDGASIEPVGRNSIYPLLGFSLKVRPSNQDQTAESISSQFVKYIQLPNTGEFYVKSFDNISIEAGFESPDMLCAFLNTEFKFTNYPTVSGSFVLDSERYIYFKSSNSAEVTTFSAKSFSGILPYMLELTTFRSNTSQTFSLLLDCANYAAKLNGNALVNHTAANTQVNITFSGGHKKSILKIYTNAAIDYSDNSAGNYITEVGGYVAANCEVIILKLISPYFKNNIFLHCNGALNTVGYNYSGLVTNEHDKLIIHLHQALQKSALANTGDYNASGSYSQPSSSSVGMSTIINQLNAKNFNINI